MAANFQGKKVRQAKYPCGVCGKQVRTNAVQCGTCIAWLHCHCGELSPQSPDHLSLLGDMTLYYTCRGCCQASFSGTFDIGLSLRRLSKYSSNFKALTAAAEHEGILLREYPVLYGLPNKVTMGPALRPDLPSIHLKSSSTGDGGWTIARLSPWELMVTVCSTQFQLPLKEMSPYRKSYEYGPALN